MTELRACAARAAIGLLFVLPTACGDDGSSGTGAATSTGAGGSGVGGQGGGGGGGCVACTGEHVWSRRFGAEGDERGSANVDAGGNTLLAFRFGGAVDFDGHAVQAVNVQDGALDGGVAKLNPSGKASWARAWGATTTAETFAAPVADATGIYVSTTFVGTVAFGDTQVSSTEGFDVALGKLSADGAPLWGKGFGADADQQVTAMAAAPGGLLTTGGSDGTLGPLTTAGGYDVWVGRFSEGGDTTWLRSFGSTGAESAYGVQPTSDGGAVIVGGFEGSFGFGSQTLTSAGSFDGFVAKLDASGNPVWAKRFGDAEGFIVLSLAVDPSNGDIVIALGTVQVVDFGGGPLAASGGYDVVVARLDASGAYKWSKRWGDAGEQLGTSVAAAGGYTVVAGDFEGTLDAGGGALTSAGLRDVFVVKLDPAGEHVWSKRFGDAENQLLASVAVDAEGHVVLAGAVAGSIDFGGGALTSAGSFDIFVAQLGP